MITPIEIRRATFSKSFRGYSTEEVDNFLSSLSLEWDGLLQENQSLKIETEKLKTALSSYQELEGMMHKTLKQAEETAKSTLENAKKDAEFVISQAEQKSQAILQNLQQKKAELEKEIRELNFRKRDILEQLKVFLSSQLEKIGTFEKELEAEPAEQKPDKKQTFSFFEQLYQRIQPNPMVQKIVLEL